MKLRYKKLTGTTTRRLDFSHALLAILQDIAQRVPEFEHLQPERILVTCGQARKRSRATSRPYAFAETGSRRAENGVLYKPIVEIDGKRVRYEIILRPLFFMRSTPQERLRTIMHELFHMNPKFDGTLDPDRRHVSLPRKEFDALLRPIIRRYTKDMPRWVMSVLGEQGEVLVLQWLERPPSRYRAGRQAKRKYGADDLFLGPVLMRNRITKH